MKNDTLKLRPFYVLYYFGRYKVGWTRTYLFECLATDDEDARKKFRAEYPNQGIKGIADYLPS